MYLDQSWSQVRGRLAAHLWQTVILNSALAGIMSTFLNWAPLNFKKDRGPGSVAELVGCLPVTQSLGFGPSVGQEEHVFVPTGLALPYRTGLQPLAHPVGAGAEGSLPLTWDL